MKRVLVVEDDRELLAGLVVNLEAAGYEVLCASDGEEGLKQANRHSPDAVIVDVMMPRLSGFDLCRTLRRQGFDAPLLFLTARAREADKIHGLGLGGDDYLTKPFSVRELLARLEAVMRRSQPQAHEAGVHRFRDLEIDFERQQIRRGNETVVLSYLELEVLQYLVERRGQVVSRDDLLVSIWGYDDALTTRAVDNLVARLRSKLEDSPRRPQHILSVYGVGYKFVG